jgi:hypothetical protein
MGCFARQPQGGAPTRGGRAASQRVTTRVTPTGNHIGLPLRLACRGRPCVCPRAGNHKGYPYNYNVSALRRGFLNENRCWK